MKITLGLSFVGILVSTFTWAVECPNIARTYKIKIADNLVRLKVDQKDCEKFDFDYTYSTERSEHRSFVPDGAWRAVADDGDHKVTERAELRALVVGDTRKVVALWVERQTLSRALEKTLRTESYFYSEDFAKGKALIERRDTFDDAGARIHRVYLGMVEDN